MHGSQWMQSAPPVKKTEDPPTVAKTVTRTGRKAREPACTRPAEGMPEARASQMKSLRTIIWLTITPARLTIPRSAMNPRGEWVRQDQGNAPIIPSGTVSMTAIDFTTELNWMTIDSGSARSEIFMTSPISERV